ncbi:hypothetical protein CDCA_CDCA05G1469 [Cyanidium caldarium]|uniref:Valine--tRNA ligase, mitochondrial n=1 Tax=Cyanidium caldarium TaxID=2771 RepID=A0AAV9ITG0_CYACA|nr:hypothetical protein CDCA_CDCA05G1469 [Cyanidium caldarium]
MPAAGPNGAEVGLADYLAMSEEQRAQLPKARQKKLARLAQQAEQKALKARAAAAVAVALPTAADDDAVAPARSGTAAVGDRSGAVPSDSKRVPEEYVDRTPRGDYKELLRKPMAPAYYPSSVEAAWNDWWEASGYYGASVEAAQQVTDAQHKFVMVIPPPNVTGSLHLGHALTCAIQDCLTRWHRMLGHVTLWLPGTDHAGIATQTVVERKLLRERDKTRHDLGRESFIEEVWRYKEEYGGRICQQLRRLGASVDWSREQFTMNRRLSRAVTEAFVRLYERGLIYRGTRLVNWCCRLRTALSDIEVEYVDIAGREMRRVPGHDREVEFGVLTQFAYPLRHEPDTEEQPTELVVATTRLETMLGDVAVAVHPDDARYRHLIGRRLLHPLIPERDLVVIGDAQLVDMTFGTGCVKVTPAHDPNDYECGQRHRLPQITVIGEDGRMNAHAGEFAGLMRYDARVAVEQALGERGLMRGKHSHPMRLGVCSRTGDVIEPLLKPQWWMRCDHMAQRALEAVRDGRITILPEFHRETWYRWLENIRDWCISRQLWWGHRIPAWRYVDADGGEERWIVARSESEARAQAPAAVRDALHQDEDVLDTWFSSGLFPFSVFGWPADADADPAASELRAFYPGTLLETGHDILFFWVARMVMLGLELTDTEPFRTVYLHAIIRDKYGRKMSKSLGNVIDPIEVIEGASLQQLHAKLLEGNLDAREVERARQGQKMDFGEGGIPECGADALRFGLLAYTLQGRDINLDVARVAAYRHFCNKLWNAARFALHLLEAEEERGMREATDGHAATEAFALEDRWVRSRASACAAACNSSLQQFLFAEAVTALYNFWLYELCDVYLEAIKPRVYNADTSAASAAAARRTLLECLDVGLRLLHPMMPFVTEELYQRLPVKRRCASIMIAPYPQPFGSDPEAETAMEQVLLLVRTVRSMRATYQVKRSARPSVSVQGVMAAAAEADAMRRLVRTLTQCGSVELLAQPPSAVAQCATQVAAPGITVYLNLAGLIDVRAELAKLHVKADEAQRLAQRYRTQLQSFDARVPDAVRRRAAEALERADEEARTVHEAIGRLQRLKLEDQQ